MQAEWIQIAVPLTFPLPNRLWKKDPVTGGWWSEAWDASPENKAERIRAEAARAKLKWVRVGQEPPASADVPK